MGFLFLGITATGWAANWVAIKILLREWPPLFSRGVSGVAAAILMAGVALAFRESLKVPRHAVMPLLFWRPSPTYSRGWASAPCR